MVEAVEGVAGGVGVAGYGGEDVALRGVQGGYLAADEGVAEVSLARGEVREAVEEGGVNIGVLAVGEGEAAPAVGVPGGGGEYAQQRVVED